MAQSIFLPHLQTIDNNTGDIILTQKLATNTQKNAQTILYNWLLSQVECCISKFNTHWRQFFDQRFIVCNSSKYISPDYLYNGLNNHCNNPRIRAFNIRNVRSIRKLPKIKLRKEYQSDSYNIIMCILNHFYPYRKYELIIKTFKN